MAVVMTAWQRPDYLRRSLVSWERADRVTELRSFRIALEPSRWQFDMLSAILMSPSWVTYEVNMSQYGVLLNLGNAVDRAFKQDAGLKFVVAAEEDLLVSTDTLPYLEWAAGEFADTDVLAVCAHNPEEGTDPSLVHKGPGFSPWVWGTWREHWEKVIWPTWDGDYSSGDEEWPQSGWDWNLDKRVIPRGGYSVLKPDMTRSQNIGEFGGAHADAAAFAATQVACWRERVPLQRYRLCDVDCPAG
jgi:hypothetical protein